MPSVSIDEMLSVEKCGDWHGEDFLSIWLCFSSQPYSIVNERDRFTPSVSACEFDAFVSSQGGMKQNAGSSVGSVLMTVFRYIAVLLLKIMRNNPLG